MLVARLGLQCVIVNRQVVADVLAKMSALRSGVFIIGLYRRSLVCICNNSEPICARACEAFADD